MNATQDMTKPNYEITGATFGAYNRGDIVPAYALMQNGDLAAHEEMGMIKATSAKVTVQLVAPVVSDPTAANMATETILENNRLRTDLDRVTQEGKEAAAKFEDSRRQTEALTEELASKVTEIDRLRRLNDDLRHGLEQSEADKLGLREETGRLRKEVDALNELMDKATVPAVAEPVKGPAVAVTETKPVVNATQRTDGSGFK